jgi:hypothetical protein
MLPRKGGIEHWRWDLPEPNENKSSIIATDRAAA